MITNSADSLLLLHRALSYRNVAGIIIRRIYVKQLCLHIFLKMLLYYICSEIDHQILQMHLKLTYVLYKVYFNMIVAVVYSIKSGFINNIRFVKCLF